MIFRKNNLNIGIGLGIFLPIFIFGILYGISSLMPRGFQLRTIALIALCANMATSHFFNKYRSKESVRGIIIVTIALAIVWFVWFGKEIFQEF